VNFPTNVKIQEVSSSFASFQLALSCEGNVYAWGINEAGEIGIDWQISSFSPTPLKVPAGETGSSNEFLSNVKAVRAGLVQSFALLENGKAVAWGKNIDGGLGIGNNTSVSTPKYVRKTVDSILENIIQLETGEGITLALVDPDNDGLGTVYIWGKNSEYSNLISRTTDLNFARPLLDANGKEINNIKQIAIGSSNALLLDRIIMFGLGAIQLFLVKKLQEQEI
jgi:alpha-tubulin suppressor-like RCC1 family protein